MHVVKTIVDSVHTAIYIYTNLYLHIPMIIKAIAIAFACLVINIL